MTFHTTVTFVGKCDSNAGNAFQELVIQVSVTVTLIIPFRELLIQVSVTVTLVMPFRELVIQVSVTVTLVMPFRELDYRG